MANGFATINGDYSLLIYDRTIAQNDLWGWNHYHLGVRDGLKVVRNKNTPFLDAFFFCLLYINNNGNYSTYPVNP